MKTDFLAQFRVGSTDLLRSHSHAEYLGNLALCSMPPCTNGLALLNMAQSTSQDASYKKTVLLPIFFFFTQKKNSPSSGCSTPEFCSLVDATPSCCADYLGYRPAHGPGCAILSCQGLHIFLERGRDKYPG